MFKKNVFNERYPGYPQNQNYQNPSYMQNDFLRLQYEIKENRHRLNNLAKRITRIESYLRIKDTSDYGYVEENQNPNDFSF